APPNVVAVLDGVQPPLPVSIQVQVVDAGAPELLVANPTNVALTVLDRAGQPFLRISAAGVQANLASPDWYATFGPETLLQPPAGQRLGGPPRWARASAGDSWGWYDTRIQPEVAQIPAGDASAAHPLRLGAWRVPVRFGTTSLTITGHFELEPLLGSYLVLANPGPDGLTTTALQGILPGLLLVDSRGLAVTVFGVDGRPFIRFLPGPSADPTGMIVQENEGSRSFVIDRQARGLPTPLAIPAVLWTTVANGDSVTWLDPRLLPPIAPPTDTGRVSAGGTWHIPITVAGRVASLTGVFTWEPASAGGKPAVAKHHGVSGPLLAVAAGLATAAVAALAALTVSRVHRSRPAS
ncbi:MAG: hypothetical protein ACYDAQ_13490, partial [Mycobacteriales bacterium]